MTGAGISPSPVSSPMAKSPMPSGDGTPLYSDELVFEEPGAKAERRARAVVDCLADKGKGATVLLIVAICAGASVASGAFDFFRNASDPITFHPAEALPVRRPWEMLRDDFPKLSHMDADVMLIKRLDGGPVISGDGVARAICDRINATISGWNNSAVQELDWYFAFDSDPALRVLAPMYLSAKNDSMVFVIQVLFTGKNPAKTGSPSGDLIHSALKLADAINDGGQYPGYRVTFTGLLATAQIVEESMLKELIRDNITTGPFIFALFWYCIGSLRLLLLPLVSVLITLALAWGFGNAISLHTQVMNTIPEMMVFIAMAMSIDYSFFLLSRFQEERQKGRDMRTAVARSLLHSGGIVVVSGAVLIVCWSAMVFFPVFGVDTIGYCNAICVFMCVATNVIVTPTCLLVFDGFFAKASFVPVVPFLRKPLPFARRGDQPVFFADLQRKRKDTAAADDAYVGTINYDGAQDVESIGDSDEASPVDLPMDTADAERRFAEEEKHRTKYYRWIAERVTRWPGKLLLPLIVYALFIAGCSALKDFSFALGLEIDYGTNQVAQAHAEVLATFPSGVFQIPAVVIAKGKKGMVWTPDYFNSSCDIGNSLANSQYVLPDSVHGVAWGNTTVDNATGRAAVQCLMWGHDDQGWDPRAWAGPWFAQHVLANVSAARRIADGMENRSACVAACRKVFPNASAENCTIGCEGLGKRGEELVQAARLYSYATRELVAADNSSAIIIFTLSFNAFSTTCRHFTDEMRGLIARANTYSAIDWAVFHPCMMEVDSEKYVMDRFPAVLCGTLAFIFCIIAARFRAVFIPVKMAATVVVPIFFVYGVATLVYVHGWLDWLGLRPFSKQGAISWLVPVCSVFMMIGLALDYDIFLFGRIYEFRRGSPARGPCGTRKSIVCALEQTGPVISAAGAIMALAFTGMFMIVNIFLNQMAFIFILGILVDTFLVRTVLVPAMLSWVGWLNWWPGEVEPLGDDDELPLLSEVRGPDGSLPLAP